MYSLIDPPPSNRDNFLARVAREFNEAVHDAHGGLMPPEQIPLHIQTYVLGEPTTIKFSDGKSMKCNAGTHLLSWGAPPSDEPDLEYVIAIVSPMEGEWD